MNRSCIWSKRVYFCSDLRKSAVVALCEKCQKIGSEIVKPPDDYNASVRKRQTAVADGITAQIPNAEKLERNKWSDVLKDIPDVNWLQVILCLMSNCGWTTPSANLIMCRNHNPCFESKQPLASLNVSQYYKIQHKKQPFSLVNDCFISARW